MEVTVAACDAIQRFRGFWNLFVLMLLNETEIVYLIKQVLSGFFVGILGDVTIFFFSRYPFSPTY